MCYLVSSAAWIISRILSGREGKEVAGWQKDFRVQWKDYSRSDEHRLVAKELAILKTSKTAKNRAERLEQIAVEVKREPGREITATRDSLSFESGDEGSMDDEPSDNVYSFLKPGRSISNAALIHSCLSLKTWWSASEDGQGREVGGDIGLTKAQDKSAHLEDSNGNTLYLD
ncbi:hypothetical protein B0H13DRAFT_1866515 [Mycena leptocephala]|nr:hypothetical protein B0H13DRAFT_1866515 [Mycena leptocephala]